MTCSPWQNWPRHGQTTAHRNRIGSPNPKSRRPDCGRVRGEIDRQIGWQTWRAHRGARIVAPTGAVPAAPFVTFTAHLALRPTSAPNKSIRTGLARKFIWAECAPSERGRASAPIEAIDASVEETRPVFFSTLVLGLHRDRICVRARVHFSNSARKTTCHSIWKKETTPGVPPQLFFSGLPLPPVLLLLVLFFAFKSKRKKCWHPTKLQGASTSGTPASPYTHSISNCINDPFNDSATQLQAAYEIVPIQSDRLPRFRGPTVQHFLWHPKKRTDAPAATHNVRWMNALQWARIKWHTQPQKKTRKKRVKRVPRHPSALRAYLIMVSQCESMQ